jgi:hypothetical protein
MSVMISARPRGSLDALAASAAMWVGARPAGRLNPAPGPLTRPLRALWAAASAAGVDLSDRPR